MKKIANIFLRIAIISLIIFIISILIIAVSVLTVGVDNVQSFIIILINIMFFSIIVAGVSVGLYILPSIIFILSEKNIEHDYDIGNSTNEFENFFKATLNKNLKELESARKKAKNFVIICVVIIFLINIISEHVGIDGTFITLLSIVCLLKIEDLKVFKNYKKTYKNLVISDFISLVNNTMIYTPEDSKLYEKYKNNYIKANFDKYKFSSFKAEDFISGFIDEKFQVKMAELYVKRRKGVWPYQKTKRLFMGIFAQIDFIKDTKTDIRISHKLIKNIDRTNEFELDSSEFERYFNVYTENRLEVMKLLTHEIMEILVNFYKNSKIEFEIIIRENKLYIRFFTPNLFEPKLIRSSKDKANLYNYYEILKFILEVTREVNKVVNDVIIE